eukprot:TRINITY_DN29053_c0_g1_i1.p1 TRINITY_DN29053_c0_g1~~TRINITY_DN29053_c0_g1_i1.p1  ORF type:complete len:295 (-),score=24.95 TRINITY_DN29053_c0_g1_i1:230-1114(-)
MIAVATHACESGDWQFAHFDLEKHGLKLYPATPLTPNWMSQLLAFQHCSNTMLVGLNLSKDHWYFGRYNGRGGVAWTTSELDIAFSISHCVQFRHKGKAVLLTHDRETGFTRFGHYDGFSNILWYPAETWRPKVTTHLLACQMDTDENSVMIAQLDNESGDWYFGNYDGKGSMTWFPRCSSSKLNVSLAVMFEHSDKAVVMVHEKDTGRTLFGDFNGHEGITWYDTLQWAPQWTTHLLCCKVANDVIILQCNIKIQKSCFMKYKGAGDIAILSQQSSWPIGKVTHIEMFSTSAA